MKENAINISCAETNTTGLLEGIRFSKFDLTMFLMKFVTKEFLVIS